MKSVLHIAGLAIILACILCSCQKEIHNQQKEIQSTSLTSSNNNCNPIGLGLALYDPVLEQMVWKNILLKWYDNQGQLKNVKFNVGWDEGAGIYNALVVEYGEVSYGTNEVHLRDILYNQEILSAKLDNQRRPIISYYNSYGRTDDYQYDTSYYTYSALNRLESIVQHRRMAGSDQTIVQTWQFAYDPDGNLITILPEGSYGGYYFKYNYSELYHPIVTTAIFSAPVKALEFMDLLPFQHHHQYNALFKYAPDGSIEKTWGFWNPRLNSDGNVDFYGYFSPAIYTAWDCNTSSMIQTRNPSQEEFMKLVH